MDSPDAFGAKKLLLQKKSDISNLIREDNKDL
jgi:hypothetical protein